MADDQRRSRSGGTPDRSRSAGKGAGNRAGQGAGKSEDRRGKPAGRSGAGRTAAGGSTSRRGSDGARGAAASRPRDAGRPDRRERDAERTSEQQRYDGPPIPEAITGRELDRDLAAQLRSLPEKLALRVARHLVAAGQLLESDPQSAYQHTLAARGRAGRLAVVREAVGEAAYAAGEYAEALQELRAARRMNGSSAYIAVMADCERALGKPDRALALLRNAPRDQFTSDQQAELVIVEAGARRDRGEVEAALRTLEQAPLESKARQPWVARLRYVYADTLLDAGRPEDALAWFHRADAIDGLGTTDAAERAAELERRLESSTD